MPRKKPSELSSSHPKAIVSEPVVTAEAPAEVHDVEVAVPDSTGTTTRKVKLELEVDTSTKDLGPNPYAKIIHLAKAFDQWRIFPRIFISTYIYLLYEVVIWYMELPGPTMEQSGLVSVVVGAGAAWFGLYTGSSKK